jgi:hypothetical protein
MYITDRAQKRWVQERLNITRGSPRFIVVQEDKILTHKFGRGSWNQHVLPLIERLTAERVTTR